jgi:hypothetical protein
MLLRQFCLLHLQVYLVQAKEDMTFLQCPAEANELFGPGARSTHLGKEVLPDTLGSDATGIPFHVHLSKGALKSHQSILPRGDCAFPALQLPLLGKKLPLQLDDHRISSRRSPTPINKQRPASQ